MTIEHGAHLTKRDRNMFTAGAKAFSDWLYQKEMITRYELDDFMKTVEWGPK